MYLYTVYEVVNNIHVHCICDPYYMLMQICIILNCRQQTMWKNSSGED